MVCRKKSYKVYDAQGRYWKRLSLTASEARAYKKGKAYKKLKFVAAKKRRRRSSSFSWF